MKIAVYCIFKNEARFVDRFVDSIANADLLVAVDTGSTDDTAYRIGAAGARHGLKTIVLDCAVVPWRFDDARNFSLAAVPADFDFCVCLDLDEVMTPGWRDTLERYYEGRPETTRFRYNYIWSWSGPGIPGLTYFADKIHARRGYRWAHPVHETLHRDRREGDEVQTFIKETLIEHFPDAEKPRSQYLPLLELAVRERPDCDRMAHYYGRELFYHERYIEAISELMRHLSLPSATWREERAASCRYIGDSLFALGRYSDAENWFYNALDEVEERETFVRLAQLHRALGDWEKCRDACEDALKYRERPNNYLNDAVTWSDWPQKMLEEALKKMARERASEGGMN